MPIALIFNLPVLYEKDREDEAKDVMLKIFKTISNAAFVSQYNGHRWS